MKRAVLILLISLIIIPAVTHADAAADAPVFLPAAFLDGLHLKEGSFGDTVRTRVSAFLVHAEQWRKASKTSLAASLTSVKAKREAHPDDPPHVKAMTFLHMWVLMIAGFICGMSVIFYLVAIAVFIFVLKRLWRILAALFRRRAEA